MFISWPTFTSLYSEASFTFKMNIRWGWGARLEKSKGRKTQTTVIEQQQNILKNNHSFVKPHSLQLKMTSVCLSIMKIFFVCVYEGNKRGKGMI